ncbi:MAG: DNA-binding transcriptional regulator Fis [Gammaproteobacteria bacterium]|nr:DNA-binding transcriptional regulator Fis [Gammaproteobacteria bacterium]
MATATKIGSANKTKLSAKPPLTNARNRPLRNVTEDTLKKYFKDLNGHTPGDLYGLVLSEVEAPLFKTVMDHTHGNQSRAAEILGMNRATLRKKLKTYYLLD